jgi:hypothetical protein
MTKYTEQIEKDAHDDTRNECIKCMFICSMQNNVRMAVESIAGNTNTLERRSRPRSTTSQPSTLQGQNREGLTVMAKWQHLRSGGQKMLLRKNVHPKDHLQECKR